MSLNIHNKQISQMLFFKINITTQHVPVVSNGRQASEIDLLVFFQVQTSC